ncbi:MAG: recombinase family protein [Planctomycetota bacterium]|nr:recombinase family protein [Planctomycetota bacterium]
MSKRRSRKRRWSDREPKVRVRWVRSPIEIPRGRPLWVLIYARYSRDEQRRRSIKAQVEFCKKFLRALGIENIRITVISDEAISGELRERPGIDAVWAGVRERRWDVIIAEDSSRPYRDDVWCVELVRLAVDNGIRVLFIGDYIDTNDPDWEPRLKDCSRHHALSNKNTSDRVKRAHEELFAVGAAIGLVKSGYRRISSAEEDDEDAPKFDEVDPRWAAIIKDAYERIAANESPWAVACRLTEAGLPKASNCRRPDWTDRNVVDLIRRTDYRGFQTYRDCYSKKQHSTGKHKPEPNDAEEVLTRQLEKLRIIEDSLWFAANDAIDARAPDVETARGRDNPQYDVPRDSRTPLSRVFFCSCGAKIHVDGCRKASYRCGKVRRGGCLIKATALRDKVHAWLRDAMLAQLRSLGDRVDSLIEQVTKILDDAGSRQAKRDRLQAKKAKLERHCRRLGRAIAKGEKKSDTLTKMLEDCEDRVARIEAMLQTLAEKAARHAPPTRAEIEDRLREIIASVERMDRTSRDDIKALVGTIRAVPYRQFGSDKVVLRAGFSLRLAALLPARTRAALKSLCDGPVHEQFECIPMLVDLFEPSTGPKYGLAALKLQEEEGLGLTAIGKKLGISKRRANIAVQYGRALREAGLTDPYIELTEPPTTASRWRNRRHQRNNPDSNSELPHSEPIPPASSGSDQPPP